jgi:ubiquinone/menaquinone biosynthesis C-methylase UbiE
MIAAALSYREGAALLYGRAQRVGTYVEKGHNMTRDFDSIARSYDAWYETPVGAWADRIETTVLFDMLNLHAGERLLDLGTGTARLALEIARQDVQVTGVDASREMLGVAQSRLLHHQAEERVRLVHGDMAALSFPDRSFDAVLTVTTLCFVADPQRVVSEAARVLRPGGRLIIGELNRWSLWSLLRSIEGLLRPTVFQSARFLGIGGLRRLTRRAGLHFRQWRGVLHLPPVNTHALLHRFDPVERWSQQWTPAMGAFIALEVSRPH